ncbi:hypothetical protein L218DRAFT_946788 [Marasmius fiardii PR-910]|nr:hypothetical protein L218DRAFT_946788 [Marasmius fiardii PR-910]
MGFNHDFVVKNKSVFILDDLFVVVALKAIDLMKECAVREQSWFNHHLLNSSLLPVGCLLVILSLALSCVGFNITIPSPVDVGSANIFQWEFNKTDFGLGLFGAFVVMLVSPPNPPDKFTCQSFGLGGDVVSQVIESFALAKIPLGTEFSGDILLIAKSQGSHVLCTFAIFDVSPNATKTTSTVNPTTLTPGSATPQDQNNHISRNGSHEIPQIVGGVIGGVALASLMLAIIIYQRFSYRKKLNQLFEQQHISPENLEATLTESSSPTYIRPNPPSYSDIVLPNEP